jgi:hypothetical protein
MNVSEPLPSSSKSVRRNTFFDRYVGQGQAASIADARIGLVNPLITSSDYEGSQEKYRTAILEQYKLCVEMADRISARRSLTNTFFVTLNTGIFALVGTFWRDRPSGSAWLLFFPLIVLVGQCLAWFWLVRSYRQLNSGKYAVIGALEELLPTSPYWKAEWYTLGEGNDKARYWPLTHLEQWVPLLFAVTYVGGFIVAVAAY